MQNLKQIHEKIISYSIFFVFAVLGNLKQNGCHGNSIHFRKNIKRQFLNVHIELNLQNFCFRRSAVTNENSLGGQTLPGKIGLKIFDFCKMFQIANIAVT